MKAFCGQLFKWRDNEQTKWWRRRRRRRRRRGGRERTSAHLKLFPFIVHVPVRGERRLLLVFEERVVQHLRRTHTRQRDEVRSDGEREHSEEGLSSRWKRTW
jgi:hypothetical protein